MSDDLGLRQVDGKEELALRDRDLMEWVEGLSEHKFSEEGEWLDECRTGVIFCKVLKGISSELSVKFDPKTKDGPAGLWKSRDNLSAYIDKLKELEVVIFESDELVDNSKPENVKSSLHDLARVAFERYGIPLPGATKAGAEIDAEAEVAEEDVDKIAQEVMLTLSQQQLPMVDLDADEDDDASAPNKSMLISMSGGLNLNSPAKDLHLSMAGGLNFDAIDDDPIDQAVEKALLARSRDPAYNSEDGIQVVRLKRGQYLLLPLKKVFFCRILSGRLMVRVGGGWSAFEVWLSRNKGFNTTPALTNGGGMKRPGSIRRGEMERKGSGRLGRKSSSKAMKADDGPETLERAGSFQNKGPLERKASGAALRRAQRHNDPIVCPPPRPSRKTMLFPLTRIIETGSRHHYSSFSWGGVQNCLENVIFFSPPFWLFSPRVGVSREAVYRKDNSRCSKRLYGSEPTYATLSVSSFEALLLVSVYPLQAYNRENMKVVDMHKGVTWMTCLICNPVIKVHMLESKFLPDGTSVD